MKIKRFLAMFAMAITLLAVPSAAMADDTWDQAKTWPASCTDDDKQAMKLYRNTDWDGTKQSECGDVWAWPDNNWGNTSEANTADENFGIFGDWGNVENLNDAVSSFLLYNKASNFGVCFFFYPHVDFENGIGQMTIWVPAKQAGSAYTAVFASDLHDPWSGVIDLLSSARVFSYMTHTGYDADWARFTKAECDARNQLQRPHTVTYIAP